MTIPAKLSPDGVVRVKCPKPDCDVDLRIKPKSARTAVTCASCGHKFVLEVANLEQPASLSAKGEDGHRGGDKPPRVGQLQSLHGRVNPGTWMRKNDAPVAAIVPARSKSPHRSA